MQRNLLILLNFLFSLSWVYLASKVSPEHQYAAYFRVASFSIIAVFMLNILALMLQKIKFLKIMNFTNRLFAIFIGIKLGLNMVAAPSFAGVLFLLFAVMPFIINIVMFGRFIRSISKAQ